MPQRGERKILYCARPGVKFRTLRTLSVEIDVPDDASAPLPTEVRLFSPGVNPSRKGPVLYDESAVTQTQTQWTTHSKPEARAFHFDLEHLSLDPDSPHYRTDAMAWADLDFRSDGSLWAVRIQWTPEGEDRLRMKKQRFTSPAFLTEDVEGQPPRVTELINAAICSLPATDQLDALVAANRGSLNQLPQGMEDKGSPAPADNAGAPALDMAALAKGLGLADDASPEDITAAMMALLQSMGLVPAPADAPAEPATQSEGAPAAPADEEEKAAASQLLSLSVRTSYAAALDEVKVWRQSHIELETQKSNLAKQREILENAERRSIGAKLVKSGIAPSLVWADDDATTLSAIYAAQPIAELRKMADRAGKPVVTDGAPHVRSESHGLTDQELAKCASRNIDPAKYAATKLALTGGKRA